MLNIEFFPPGQGIQMSSLLQPLAVLVTEFDSAENVAQRPVNGRVQAHARHLRQVTIGPHALLCHIVRPAGLSAGTNGRILPPAKRLPFHNGAGDTPVDVGIAHLNVFAPIINLVLIQGMNTAGQAEAGGVLQLDGLLQGVGPHDA